MTARPFHVFRTVRATEVADHYRHLAWTVPYDGAHLHDMADKALADGSGETAVAHYETRDEADADAARRNAANSTPGIRYRAEFLDVDEDWWSQ